MIDITVSVAATLLIPIPNSVSGDTVTYEIFSSSGTVAASGSMTFVRDEVWKVAYTPAATGVYTLKANDTTLSEKRENFYNVVAADASTEDDETTLPLSVSTDLLIPIPGSSSTDVVTYEIFNSSGTVIDSGTMDFVRDEVWKVDDFAGDDTGLIVLKANDTTINVKRENFYKISSGFFGVISVANKALRHLSMDSIASLDEDTPNSRAVVEYFTIARDEALEAHRWSFATVVEELVENENVDTDDYPDWLFFYDYPANALAVWNVFNGRTNSVLTDSFPGWGTASQLLPAGSKEEQDFEVRYNPTDAEQVICSNLSEAFVEYTYKVTDTTQWSRKFIMAFSYKLAAMMAHSLTGDAKMGLTLTATFNALISEAKRLDHSQKKKKPDQSSGYVRSRG